MSPPPSISRKPLFAVSRFPSAGVFEASAGWVALAGLFACSPGTPEARGTSGPPTVLVRLAEVRAGALETTLGFPAEVQAGARSRLASGADGAVTEVAVEVGDPVRTGQVLVRVDDRLPRSRMAVARAELERAKTEAQLARTERDRMERLEPGTIPELELDRARSAAQVAAARVEAAEATLQERTADLAQFVVRSPYDGVVSSRQVDPGTWVRPGEAVLDLVSTEDLEIIVDASRVLAGRVQAGSAATIRSSGASTPGRVTGVVPALDPISRTLRIRVVPDGASSAPLLPGDAVEVAFEVRLDEEGVLVSTDALLESPDETRVFEVEEGVAALRTVEVLGRSGDRALVRGEGLESGDRVVVRGNERLRPGQSVRVGPAGED